MLLQVSKNTLKEHVKWNRMKIEENSCAQENSEYSRTKPELEKQN